MIVMDLMMMMMRFLHAVSAPQQVPVMHPVPQAC